MSDADFDALREAFQDIEHENDETLDRVGTVLAQIEPVRVILRLIARQSRDDYARDQAEEALRLLEVPDGSS